MDADSPSDLENFPWFHTAKHCRKFALPLPYLHFFFSIDRNMLVGVTSLIKLKVYTIHNCILPWFTSSASLKDPSVSQKGVCPV